MLKIASALLETFQNSQKHFVSRFPSFNNNKSLQFFMRKRKSSLSSAKPLFLSLSFHFSSASLCERSFFYHQFLPVSCHCRMSTISSPTSTTSPSKKDKRERSFSTSPKKSPNKKLKTTNSEESENMPVEVSPINNVVEAGEPVLKEIGNVKSIKEIKEESSVKLYFVKMTDKAHVPTRGSKLAAGYDLKSAYEYTVPARGSCLVKTDIQIKLPSGTYGRIAPRSGLALKNKIDVGGGVIDEDYRGNVGVILFNHGDDAFEVKEGDRVAQLICQKIYYPEAVELKNLDETERGEGGFGSTGINEVKA